MPFSGWTARPGPRLRSLPMGGGIGPDTQGRVPITASFPVPPMRGSFLAFPPRRRGSCICRLADVCGPLSLSRVARRCGVSVGSERSTSVCAALLCPDSSQMAKRHLWKKPLGESEKMATPTRRTAEETACSYRIRAGCERPGIVNGACRRPPDLLVNRRPIDRTLMPRRTRDSHQYRLGQHEKRSFPECAIPIGTVRRNVMIPRPMSVPALRMLL